jgi:hypothetical protein
MIRTYNDSDLSAFKRNFSALLPVFGPSRHLGLSPPWLPEMSNLQGRRLPDLPGPGALRR